MVDKSALEDAKIPDWAMEDARAIWKGMGFVSDRLSQVSVLALALVAVDARAEQRGRKAGIERALPTLERLRHWIEDEVGAELPFTEAEQAGFDAIRSLGEQI